MASSSSKRTASAMSLEDAMSSDASPNSKRPRVAGDYRSSDYYRLLHSLSHEALTKLVYELSELDAKLMPLCIAWAHSYLSADARKVLAEEVNKVEDAQLVKAPEADQVVALPRADARNARAQEPEVEHAQQEKARKAAARLASRPIVDFQYLSTRCWHSLNTASRGGNSSAKCRAAMDASSVLSSARNTISRQCGAGRRWETRRNGLETLRKICKSTFLCNDRLIKHEVLGDGMVMQSFGDAAWKIAKTFSDRERVSGGTRRKVGRVGGV